MSDKEENTTGNTPEAGAETSGESIDAMRFLYRWNSEVISFYTHRYQQDTALPMALLACKSPEDLLNVQRDFLQQLIADYSSEAATL